MMIPEEPKTISVHGLSLYELNTITEAVHFQLLRYMRWSLDPQYHIWRGLAFPAAQMTIDLLASAYTKLAMAFKEQMALEPAVPVHSKLVANLEIPPEVWDQINAVTLATSWDEVPIHPLLQAECSNNPCSICQTLMEA